MPDNAKHQRLFAVTVRRTKDPKAVTKEAYLEYMEAMSLDCKFTLDEFVFEKKNGLHMHGIVSFVPWNTETIETKGPIYTKEANNPMKHLLRRGWHLYIVPITNKEGWQSYCQKELTVKKMF